MILLFSGCTKRVSRLEPDTAIDLSGRWNDTDSRLVAQKLITACLVSDWYVKFKETNSRKPVVIIGSVKNKTLEHIKVETFVKDLEKAILNSGFINIVAGKSERIEIREERTDMQKWASIRTRKEYGAETGADYIMKGVLNSIIDEEAGKKIAYYQVDMSLINIEDNSIIWSGQKKIKKYIRRPLFKL